jgi:glycosyltransferase involved in cell wall biosynthesis
METTTTPSLNNLVNWLQFRLSWCADRVVFPDAHRAHYFNEKARLSFMPEVVMNTPLYLATLPNSTLKQMLKSKGVGEDFKIVIYQGGIDKRRSIPEVIESVRFWPDKTVLVLIGVVHDEKQRNDLFSAIRECTEEKRIVYIEYVSHDELFGYLRGADLGLAFYQPSTLLQAFYAGGGSNKIFEYLALGIPVVTTDSSYFREIMSDDFLYFANPYSPQEIGAVIYAALADDAVRAAKARAARCAHIERYHYEKQFAPILEYINQKCLF